MSEEYVYEFVEYPKWVRIGDNEPVLCEDAKAEKKLRKGIKEDKPEEQAEE